MAHAEDGQATGRDSDPWLTIIALGRTGAEVLDHLSAPSMSRWAEPCRMILAASDPMALECTTTTAIRLLLQESLGRDAGGSEHRSRDHAWLREALRETHLVLLATDLNELKLAIEIGNMARDQGALVISFAQEFGPFEPQLDRLRSATDTLVAVPSVARETPPIAQGVLSIADSLLHHGFIGVDFADFRVIFGGHQRARLGIGWGDGEGRAVDAALRAMASPLLAGMLLKEARGLLLVIYSGPEGTLTEINDVATLIQKTAHADTNIVFTSVIEPCLGNLYRVVLCAMGEAQPVGGLT